MDKITEEDFERASGESSKLPKKEDKTLDFDTLLKEMENPVQAQKRLAVQIKVFLDERIETEMNQNGYLSENTRKWVDTFNNILEKIQKALHGDKSVNLHLHKISHSQIAAKIRESEKGKYSEEDDENEEKVEVYIG